ncbi:hypothetical protein D3C81_1430040 [compost metagenome]
MEVIAGLPIAVELHQLGRYAFEQQALIEDERVEPLFVAVADKNRHGGWPL